MAPFFRRVMLSPRAARPDVWSDHWYGSSSFPSVSGERVTVDSAMTLSHVWSAVTQMSRDVASCAPAMYRFLPNGGKAIATNHPLHDVLHYDANIFQSALEFWEMMVAHLLLRGNAYAQILEGPRGFADQLIPRHPDRITPERLPDGSIRYQWLQPNGQRVALLQDDLFVIRGLSDDGLKGLSVIEYGARNFGTALAQESYLARFYSQNATPAGVLQHPGVIGEDGQKNLRASINSYTQGLDNAHGFLILEEGMQWKQIGVKPEDAQVIASRQFSVGDCARWFGIPAHKIGASREAETYASVEQANIEYVMYTLRALVKRIELRIRKDLILAPQIYFTKFDLDELLRGDSVRRAEVEYKHFTMASITPNEIRTHENRNPLPGGDRLFVPANMIPVEMAGQVSQQPLSQPKAQVSTSDVRAVLMTQEAAQRVVRKEVAAASKAATKFANDGEGWSAWVREFYGEHAGFVAQTLRIPLPAARAYAAKQGLRLEQHGISVLDDGEWTAATELAELALLNGHSQETA